ncbi:MAG TPA: ABC transporter ATP-binding protein [Planctomycetota bacterium]|nr:ABC transporter ATP-binding protein [Planctomycetota bacterium]
MTPLAIRTKNLVKRYSRDVLAVDGLDLEVRQGECFGLLGPNGAGKTTSIEILEGILRPTSGEVEVLGHAWGKNDRQLRQKIGITLQETRLSEKLTVLETLRLFRSFYQAGIEPEKAIELVDLGEKTRARVGKLSGGQRQRLAVACAIVGDPKLLFLDEPTTGLDPQSRRQIWDILRRFRQEGRTILLTTHYMDEAERLCDRVAIVDHGRVIALGSPSELIASLGGEHVVELAVGDANGNPSRPAGLPSEEELRTLPGVSGVHVNGSEIQLTTSKPHVVLPPLIEKLEGNEGVLAALAIRHASLEDVFVKLTGRHLKEGEASP